MTAYLIKGLSRKGMQVFTYTDMAAAERASETRFREHPTTIAASHDDLSSKSGPALVSLYNGLIPEGEKPIERFMTRSAGAERVFELLVKQYQHQPVESESASVAPADATTSNEEDMATKGKKSTKTAAKKTAKPKTPKAPKAPKEKKVRAPRVPKDRNYKAEVVSKGSEKAKASALDLIQRANGATADEIKERLGVSLGTAKNLVWYLRRDGHKIVVDRTKERKPYVIK